MTSQPETDTVSRRPRPDLSTLPSRAPRRVVRAVTAAAGALGLALAGTSSAGAAGSAAPAATSSENCTPAQIEAEAILWHGSVDGTRGSAEVRFSAIAGDSCTLAGYPARLSLLDARGNVVEHAQQSGGETAGEEITVSGQAMARTAISYTARAEECVEKRVTAVNIQIPGTDTVLYVPFAGSEGFVVCEGTAVYGQMYSAGT
ncbi:DUF4232 domain-containing protein [Streptomyces bohaiensis]|uniref:DUF4232 domain-containing protein n=1 Tax=Streptomyces bohaiensis TaxID=1431344 RepID=UPI003B7EE40F